MQTIYCKAIMSNITLVMLKKQIENTFETIDGSFFHSLFLAFFLFFFMIQSQINN